MEYHPNTMSACDPDCEPYKATTTETIEYGEHVDYGITEDEQSESRVTTRKVFPAWMHDRHSEQLPNMTFRPRCFRPIRQPWNNHSRLPVGRLRRK